MALNDIRITELPEMVASKIGPNSLVTSVDGLLNYRLKLTSILEWVLSSIEDIRPLGELSLVTSTQQTITGSEYNKITSFDKIQYEDSIDVDMVNDEIIILHDGDYRVTPTINFEVSNGTEIEFAVLLNGVESETLGYMVGRGAGKPIYIGGADIDPYVKGNVITLGAREVTGADADLTFNKVRLTVEKV